MFAFVQHDSINWDSFFIITIESFFFWIWKENTGLIACATTQSNMFHLIERVEKYLVFICIQVFFYYFWCIRWRWHSSYRYICFYAILWKGEQDASFLHNTLALFNAWAIFIWIFPIFIYLNLWSAAKYRLQTMRLYMIAYFFSIAKEVMDILFIECRHGPTLINKVEFKEIDQSIDGSEQNDTNP